MERRVEPELLDALPADDPRALSSRRDLRRLNRVMGTVPAMSRVLCRLFPTSNFTRVTEIGAGDGHFLLRLARVLQRPDDARQRSAVLVDQHHLLENETEAEFRQLGWTVTAEKSDALEFFRNGAEPADVILANLFLHHLDTPRLRELLHQAATKTRVFVALEPRRAAAPFYLSHLVKLIGCCEVTCNDAPISIRAGFTGHELSALWPADGQWQLTERRAGVFTHLFVAQRK